MFRDAESRGAFRKFDSLGERKLDSAVKWNNLAN